MNDDFQYNYRFLNALEHIATCLERFFCSNCPASHCPWVKKKKIYIVLHNQWDQYSNSLLNAQLKHSIKLIQMVVRLTGLTEEYSVVIDVSREQQKPWQWQAMLKEAEKLHWQQNDQENLYPSNLMPHSHPCHYYLTMWSVRLNIKLSLDIGIFFFITVLLNSQTCFFKSVVDSFSITPWLREYCYNPNQELVEYLNNALVLILFLKSVSLTLWGTSNFWSDHSMSGVNATSELIGHRISLTL